MNPFTNHNSWLAYCKMTFESRSLLYMMMQGQRRFSAAQVKSRRFHLDRLPLISIISKHVGWSEFSSKSPHKPASSEPCTSTTSQRGSMEDSRHHTVEVRSRLLGFKKRSIVKLMYRSGLIQNGMRDSAPFPLWWDHSRSEKWKWKSCYKSHGSLSSWQRSMYGMSTIVIWNTDTVFQSQYAISVFCLELNNWNSIAVITQYRV